MILFRSIAFNVLFYLNTFVYLIAALPTFFMPYRAIIAVAKSWGRTNLVLLRVVAGIDCEIRGREKIPKGPIIVASKHQSAWETFALLPLLARELPRGHVLPALIALPLALVLIRRFAWAPRDSGFNRILVQTVHCQLLFGLLLSLGLTV